MNISKTGHFFRTACRLATLLAVLLAGGVSRAQSQQPARYLLIFETSPVMKKNLPLIRQMLGEMFSSNLQNQMKTGDDLAVWTVDETLHTGTFPLQSWTPDNAADYTDQLNDFLGHQKYRRKASLAGIQPLLDHVVQNSEKLTVLIFCDGQARISGTPYDSGMSDILTNAMARLNGVEKPFVIVLRSYHGEYLGCSVNRSGLLNFPPFPAPPPPPQPQPVVKAVPAPAPAPVTGPVVTPIQALVIIGTNASTNASALVKPAAAVAPGPNIAPAAASVPPPPVSPAVTAPAAPTTPASIILSGPPPTPAPVAAAPVQATPAPAPISAPQNTIPPQTPVGGAPVVESPPAGVTPSPAQAAPVSGSLAAVPGAAAPDTGYLWPLVIAGIALLAAVVIVFWLVMRGRRPQGSLITSSMQDDPRLPPRK